MRADIAGRFIIEKLDAGLPRHLTYHNATHTRDVHSAAKRIAETEGVSKEQLDLLLTAAWFHDAGYLYKTAGHEDESCVLARQYLPAFEFNAIEIEQICQIIEATRVPQSPKELLGQILADADLDYLGRDDFFETAAKLHEELNNLAQLSNDNEWNLRQVQFLENHFYFTKTAINTRQPKKELNLAAIKARLSY